MNKAAVVSLHVGYWLLYLLLLGVMALLTAVQLAKGTSEATIFSLYPFVLICVLPNIFSFYALYFAGFGWFLSQQKLLPLTLFGALVCIVSAVFGMLISLAIFGANQPIFSEPLEFFQLFLVLALIAAIHGGIALVIRGFVNWFDEVKLRDELIRKTRETEIALVSSRLNPHFLFNTINNIDVLISKDPARASTYLNKLSSMLRYLLYEAGSDKIELHRELNHIAQHVELEKIRTTNQDYVRFEVEGEANGRQIAPMIYTAFIENAFKHTEHNKQNSQITIKTTIVSDRIDFEIENTCRRDRVDENNQHSGLGIALTRRRLELIYPNKHTLEITENDGIYRVKLSIHED